MDPVLEGAQHGRGNSMSGEAALSDDRAEIDLDLVEELTKRETAALDRKHARSIAYRQEAARHLPGGVSSSWQSWPPHPIYVDRGLGSRVWDIDGNEYVDYHNGYGVMVMGHAHPKIVEAVQRRAALGTHFAQPTEDALIVAAQLAERYRLPYWRLRNSRTAAPLPATPPTPPPPARPPPPHAHPTHPPHPPPPPLPA